MKNSNSSLSSSPSKQSYKKNFSKLKTKTSLGKSNLRKLRTEDFSLKRKLMNQNLIGSLKIICKEYQQQIFLVLEDPSSSLLAKILQITLLFSILLSCISIIVDSILENSNQDYNSISSFIELYLFCFFGLEYVLRLVSSTAFEQKLWKFAMSPMNVIDLFSLIPFLLNLTLAHASFQQLRILRLIRFTRVFRLFKISRFMKEMYMLAETVKNSLKDMLILLTLFVMLVLLFSTTIYYLENDEEEVSSDSINSIPKAIWWCVVTMTTVGYGDLIPHTIQGKFLASLAAILGTTTISLPVAIIGINLFRTLKDRDETVEIEELKSKFNSKNDVETTTDQLNLRELQFMENRLEQLYENNEKVLDCLAQSQQLFDELTTNLMSLYTALAEELDLHLEQRMKRLKMKQKVLLEITQIMKLEKNLEQKKSIELNQLIHSYKEKQQLMQSPMLEDSRIESANSMHSRLQSYGNIKRVSRVYQLSQVNPCILRSSREISSHRICEKNSQRNSERHSQRNSGRMSEEASFHPSHIICIPNPMDDTPVGAACHQKNKLQVSIDSKSNSSNKSDNSEDCDIQNKINELK